MISGVPNLNPNDIESVNIKSEGSKFKYGEAGKNGVIEIRTKSAVAPQPGDGLKAEINNEELNQNISLKTINKELIILDSKEITKSDLNQLKVGSISTMKFLKGTAAVNVYGEKGINGVIIITTKQ
jgi:TonB-dependent SusC/RagA subfamily outer membrane receptor